MKTKHLLLIPLLLIATLQIKAQISPDSSNIIYVNKDVSGGNQSGDSWGNAIPEVSDALKWVRQEVDNNTASWLPNDSIQIYVAEGLYKPLYDSEDSTYTNDRGRANSFVMINNVQLYGGFPDTGNPVMEDRDWDQFSTILSGDIGVLGSNIDNVYHVVISTGNIGNALLDGFTIKGGNANITSGSIQVNGVWIVLRWGAGIFTHTNSSPTFKNLIIKENTAFYGGGMFNKDNSSPLMTNVTFYRNISSNDGGGMYNEDGANPIIKNSSFIDNTGQKGGGLYNNSNSSPTLISVIFKENTANYGSGGALFNSNSSPIIKNSTFVKNTATDGGGAVYNYNSHPTIINSLFVKNNANDGGAIYNHNSTQTTSLINVTITENSAKNNGGGIFNTTVPRLNIYNSLIYGNTANINGNNILNSGSNNIAFKHSLMGGASSWQSSWGTDNGNNIPLATGNINIFLDVPNNIFSLKSNSPAIDAGSNSLYTSAGGNLANDTDLTNQGRVYDYSNNGVIDIGAHEFHPFIPGDSRNFITIWEVKSQDLKIIIPTDSNFDYQYRVYWEDISNTATNDTVYNLKGNDTIIFPTAGIYKVEIDKTFPSISFNNSGDKDKIYEVNQWGTNKWQNMKGAFWGANNLQITASDTPNISQVTNMAYAFASTNISVVNNINYWNVENVTDMNNMFSGAASFNQDISNWKVDNVTDMNSMFSGAASFNQDISTWNVDNVTDMSSMFSGAAKFNQDISSWKVDNVTDMSSTFSGATKFNQDISTWKVDNVTDMSSMFSSATSFDQDISTWNVSNVSDMDNLFKNATKFDQNLAAWDLSSISNSKISFENSGLSCINYTKTLVGWANNPTSFYVTLNATGMNYGKDSTIIANRNGLINFLKWTIIGDNEGSCTLSVEELKNQSISVYPNPAHDFITIKGLKNNATIRIIDVSGRIVKRYSIKNSEARIELNNLSNGVYNVIINTEDDKVNTKKILKY